jgi:hypothetical protein
MVRVPLSRRLTAVTALLALLLSPWESAQACDHVDTPESHAAEAEAGHDSMASGPHSCHDQPIPTDGQDRAANNPQEGGTLEGTEMGDCHDSNTMTGCCATGCCASPGIPLDPIFLASLGAPTWDQPNWSPSYLPTGEPVALFRPPIG